MKALRLIVLLFSVACTPSLVHGALVGTPSATITMGTSGEWNWNVSLNPVGGDPNVVQGNFNVAVVDRPVSETETMRMIVRAAEVLTGDVMVYSAVGSVVLDADPFVAYSFGVTNFLGAATTYGFSFSSPYILGPYDQLTSTHQSGVTDGGGGAADGSVTVSPGVSGFVHNPFLDGPDVGLPAALSGGCSVGGGSSSCFTSFTTTTPVTAGVSGTFGSRVDFTLSGFDAMTTSGRVELVATPEPGSFVLLAAGLTFLSWAGIRNRRR